MVTTNVSSRRSIEEITGSGAPPPPRQSASQFSKGAVVSLRMKNFLVYKDVIAVFGPRLNVVVGPNGSGKSTLVCAIALGLAGTPKVLGRADNLSSFVMHGVKEDASVTVELFMPQEANMLIKRTFSRRNNSSIWHVNGRSQSEKEVRAKVAALGIQVDNLCTMLPQDKVGDFSGFSPDKLLLETQKALSFEQLYTPHLKLMDLQESTGKDELEEESTGNKLKGMEVELTALEKDVRRYKERQEKQDKLALLEKRRIWLRAEELQNEGREANQALKLATAELANATDANFPLEDAVKTSGREVDRLQSAVTSRSKQWSAHKAATIAAGEKIERMVSEATTQRCEIKNMETRRRNKQEKLTKSVNDLATMKDKLEGAREQSAASPCVKDLLAQMTAKQNEIADLTLDLSGQKKNYDDAQYGIRLADGNIKQLSNLKANRERRFREHYRDNAEVAIKVRDWAAHNADKLRGPVSGPIALEVTVEDPEAATAVETHVPRHTWCSLVVNYKEDHDTIIQAFRNEKRSISVLVNQGGVLKPRQPIFSSAEMEGLRDAAGVRGFLDDFISCPDTIRQTLRRNAKIDRTFLGSAITQSTITSDPTFLSKLSKPVRGVATGSVIYAGGAHGAASAGVGVEPLQQYSTKISLYGQRQPSVRVSETREAQVIGKGVDEAAVEREQEKKAGHEQQLRAAGQKRKKVSGLITALDGEVDTLRNECKNITSLKATEKRFEAAVQKTEKAIQSLKEELAENGDAEKVNNINRLEKVLKQHVEYVKQAQEHLDGMLDTALEFMAANLAKRAASDKLEYAREELYKAQQSQDELRRKVKTLTAEKKKIATEFRAEVLKAQTRAPKRVGDTDELTDFGEQFDDLPSTKEALEAGIEDINEDLAQTVNNPQVIEKYEKLKKEVEETSQALSELKERNSNSSDLITSISDPWTELLQNTVDKLNDLFREYMSKMDGCVGEIVLAKAEAYKRWGVEIRVRFRSERDQGKMSVLNKLVHSGGERSVSTILYLMALQDLQHSPFRVVDEINQGMDPKNERGVFSRIVLNSCGPSRKQYFLITPKLLQGLVAMDNDDVTIIVIMNGKNIMNGTSEHSMRNFINAKKRQLAMQAGMENGDPPKQLRTVR